MPITHGRVMEIVVEGDTFIVVTPPDNDDKNYWGIEARRNKYRFDGRIQVRKIVIDKDTGLDQEVLEETLKKTGRVVFKEPFPDMAFDYEFSGNTVLVDIYILPPGSLQENEGGAELLGVRYA